jgi:hypothetical protein
MKKDIKFFERKNNHLEYIVDMLTKTVIEREAEIKQLKSVSSTLHQFSEFEKKIFSPLFKKISLDPIIDKANKPEWYKEKLFHVSKPFSSRFMPNVKFIADDSFSIDDVVYPEGCYITSFSGCGLGLLIFTEWDENFSDYREVSIYEAIPEYDKEGNSLVGMTIVKDTPEDWAKKNVTPNINPEKEKLAKELNIKNGILEDDVAFKVTEVVSKCDSCKTKDDCSLLRELHCSPTVSHCDDYRNKNSSDKDGDFESMFDDDFNKTLQKDLDDAADNIDIECLAEKISHNIYDEAMKDILASTCDSDIQVGFVAGNKHYVSFDGGAGKIWETNPLYDAFFRVNTLFKK